VQAKADGALKAFNADRAAELWLRKPLRRARPGLVARVFGPQ